MKHRHQMKARSPGDIRPRSTGPLKIIYNWIKIVKFCIYTFHIESKYSKFFPVILMTEFISESSM